MWASIEPHHLHPVWQSTPNPKHSLLFSLDPHREYSLVANGRVLPTVLQVSIPTLRYPVLLRQSSASDSLGLSSRVYGVGRSGWSFLPRVFVFVVTDA